MKKKAKLIKKINAIIKRADLPRYLHKYGPKKYELWGYIFSLIVKSLFRLSYRRACNLLNMLGFNVPSKSSLQRQSKNIPRYIWKRLLNATIDFTPEIVAIDGTGLSRTSISWYYVNRIGGVKMNSFYKLSVCIDVIKKRF
jgi:hypothetical protein